MDDEESDAFFWTTSGFLQPSSLALAHADQGPEGLALRGPAAGGVAGGAEVLKSLPAMFDARGMTVTQGEATSKDGTKVHPALRPAFLLA